MLVYSIIDSPACPSVSAEYRQRGITEEIFNTTRKAISRLKKHPPDALVAEFRYGYANNYAGVNISNLDVMLMTMQRYAPQTRVIVLVSKNERQHVDQLNAIFPLHKILVFPVSPAEIADAVAG